MFAARCMAVSLAVFILAYSALSLAVSRTWHLLSKLRTPRSTKNCADSLFVMRIFPLAASAAVTLLFTLPSFLWLEPRSTDEAIGTAPVLLGIVCVALFALGFARSAAAHISTSRAAARWLKSGNLIATAAGIPFVRAPHAPALAVTGMTSPKVFVSEATLAALTPGELRVAVRHELSHARRYDNVKKLLFRFAVFPGMSGLHRQWSEATELAADDAAVSSRREALDLAAALIKVSKLCQSDSSPALATGLLNSSTALSLRIERLFRWEINSPAVQKTYRWRSAFAAAGLAALFILTYTPALVRMHALTEWLVR